MIAMLSKEQINFLHTMMYSAQQAAHKWPGAAAAEAAAETGWGVHIPHGSNNVLGIKAYRGWTGPTVGATGTAQNKDGSWTGPQSDQWCVFSSPVECFKEQMLILQEPRYAAAMDAPTIESYIVAECAVWSTGIEKGKIVLQIYNSHKDILSTPQV